MILSLRKWIDRAKFILLFVVLTFVLYQILSVLSLWMEPVQRYKQPSGSAVKVFHQDSGTLDADNMPERLRLFYWYGE
ncbi:DUF4227 family protein [Gorillibacterium sp. sgz5001074]|uniref:DUF4227 family protein n=1 Tax=Gorillibacterium sp. sgz5001074 TaxID=3446695 RepID=UPI003F67B6CB